jgi:hypothetical protein
MRQHSIYVRPADEEMFSRAVALARDQRRSLSAVIAAALEDWVKHYDDPDAEDLHW